MNAERGPWHVVGPAGAFTLAVLFLLTMLFGGIVKNSSIRVADAIHEVAVEMRLDREAMEKCAGHTPDERAAQGAKDGEQ